MAAFLVAVYHIWIGRISGGVDVFFVISAFLLTESILAAAGSSGRVDFVGLWGRLIRRLVPAAMLVAFAIAVASMHLLPKIRWSDTIKDLAASIVYLENWRLAFTAVDYLDQSSAPGPYRHFWALSVQGQFYVLCPLFAALAFSVGRRAGVPPGKSLLFALAPVFLASFGYALHETRTNQAFAYFDTFARLWEFSIGAALAVLMPSLALAASARVAMGWAGLLAVLSCGLVLPVSTSFPGAAALWPTLAASMIIASGSTGSPLGADRLLSNRIFTALGDVSYSLYLWHLPVFLFYKTVLGSADLGHLDRFAVLGFSIALAWLTTKAVERPLRYAEIGTRLPWGAFALGACCVVPVAALLLVWTNLFFEANRFDHQKVAADDPDYPGALALEGKVATAASRRVAPRPGPLAVRQDVPEIVTNGCIQTRESAEAVRCEYGSRDSSKIVALAGSSHVGHWFPAVLSVAEKRAWRLVIFVKADCRLGLEEQPGRVAPHPSCRQWNKNVVAELLALRPDLLLTVWHGGGAAGASAGALLATVQLLESAGVEVTAIRDTPWMDFDVPACVERSGTDSPDCRRRQAAVLHSFASPDLLAQASARLRVIDLTRYFCPDAVCVPVVGNVTVYRDGHHITATYARTLAPVLDREISRLLR